MNPTHLFSLTRLAVLLMAVPLLTNCAAGTSPTASTGVAVYQDRRLETAANDLRLEMKIADEWLNFGKSLITKTSVEVYESRALLTGVVKDPELRATAVRLAWKVPGIIDVYNEIQVYENEDFIDMARDSWITAKLKTLLTLNENIFAINYIIETVRGVVYLIGVAQDQKELDLVISQARDMEYVRNVVSHVRLKDKG